METLPPELVACLVPSDPDAIGTLTLVSRRWREMVRSSVQVLEVPMGKAMRFSFLSLFPACLHFRGLVALPSFMERGVVDQRKALSHVLGLHGEVSIAISSLSSEEAVILREHLQVSGSPTNLLVSNSTILYGRYERRDREGRLSLELAYTLETSRSDGSGAKILDEVFRDIPVNDVFLDVVGRDREGEPYTRKFAMSTPDPFFPFFFRKTPHTIRFKGPHMDRLWSSILKNADWPLRVIRLQAFPPCLGLRERIEKPLLNEEGYVDVPEPPKHSFDIGAYRTNSNVTEYWSPLSISEALFLQTIFPSLHTFFVVEFRFPYDSLRTFKEDSRIVNIRYNREEWFREKRRRKGLPYTEEMKKEQEAQRGQRIQLIQPLQTAQEIQQPFLSGVSSFPPIAAFPTFNVPVTPTVPRPPTPMMFQVSSGEQEHLIQSPSEDHENEATLEGREILERSGINEFVDTCRSMALMELRERRRREYLNSLDSLRGKFEERLDSWLTQGGEGYIIVPLTLQEVENERQTKEFRAFLLSQGFTGTLTTNVRDVRGPVYNHYITTDQLTPPPSSWWLTYEHEIHVGISDI